MADPTAYTRDYGFANYQASHPSDPLPGDQVDAELNDVAARSAEIVAAIKSVRRSDGGLQNGIVHNESLDSTLQVALSGATALAAQITAAQAAAASATTSAATATTQAGIATAAAAALAGNVNNRRIVRVASTANVTISNPGTAVFDGVTLTAGDRVLLKNQSTGSQNGIYDFNGSGVAMTRSTDSDTSGEMTPMLEVSVSEGTANAGANCFLTTPAPITLGTTALVFRQDQNTAKTATPEFAGLKVSSTSAVLTDYQEGTWTPVDGFSAFVWGASGYYVKVGKVVRFWCVINTGAQASATAMQVSGLPFVAGATGGADLQMVSGSTNGAGLQPWIVNRSTVVIKPLSGGAFSAYQNTQIYISGSYTTQA